MELNTFLFPAPPSSYTSQTFAGDIIYIPKYNRNQAGDIVQFQSSTYASIFASEPELDDPLTEESFPKANQPTTARRRPRISERKLLMTSFVTSRRLNRGHTVPVHQMRTLRHCASEKRLDTANSCDGIAAELPVILNHNLKTLTKVKKNADDHLALAQRNKRPSQSNGSIPCLFLPYRQGSSKIIIYFHGNGVDIGISREQCLKIKDRMKVRPRRW